MARMFRYWPVALFLLCLPLAGQDAAPTHSSVGLPVDWSYRHLIHSRPWTASAEAAARREPRLLYNRLTREPRSASAAAGANQPAPNKQKAKPANNIDWQFTLGTGKVAFGMSPAKFTFDPAATPSCTTDYVVFALDVAGTASQPNLVRFNNLYSEPGGTGFCPVVRPSVLSAYNITTVATGKVLTSPSLSLDGTKLAFIETVTGAGATCPGLGSPSTCSIFHVLTFGTTGSNGIYTLATNSYTTAVPGSSNNAVMTSLTYSSSTTTFSSPWVDYHNDVAYFGDDNGKLYKTTCVFLCGSAPAIAAGWPIPVAAAGVKLSPPVMDSTSNKIFLGGSDGNLYVVDLAVCPSGCAVGPRPSVAVGSTDTFGGVIDAPMVDTTFGTVFAFAGDNLAGAGGAGVVVQTDTALTSLATVTMGNAGFNIMDGAFDDTYYTNTIGSATAVGFLYSCGTVGGSGQPALYAIPFTNTGTLSTSNPPKMGLESHQNIPGNANVGCSPLMEFKNGATDRLFFSQASVPTKKCTTAVPVDGCIFMYTLSSGGPSASPVATAVEKAGTSGIIVDNSSASAQASSIYFTNQATGSCVLGGLLPAYCAFKLTQSALQ